MTQTSAMQVQGIYACAAVNDLEAGLAFYSALMGREPDDRPMPGLAQWRNMDRAGVQLWEDRERAGKGLMTIVVPVMAVERARLEAAGLMLEPDVAGDFGIVAQISDPDGNRITLAEPPKGFVGR